MNWMSSQPALRNDLLTNDLRMPHLVDIVANIIAVWPLIVFYLKETGWKDDGDSLVVRSSYFDSFGAFSYLFFVCVMFRRREWTGTSTWTKWRFSNFVCCISLLKSVKSSVQSACEFYWARNGSGKICAWFPRNELKLLLDGSTFRFSWIVASDQTMDDGGSVSMSVIYVFVSGANNFAHSSTAADHGHHSFGELAGFIYCFLQKIKNSSSLSLVDQWEEYVVPNHSRFPEIDEKHFLWHSRDGCIGQSWEPVFTDSFAVMAVALSKSLWIVYCRPLLRDRWRGISCFCPSIVVGGDDVAPFKLFSKLLDGLLEKERTRDEKL